MKGVAMRDLTADPVEIHACVGALRRIRQEAANIMALAVEANPDPDAWGQLGKLMSPFYWNVADDLYRHLGMMGEALQDKADALEACASNYVDTDRALREALEAIHKLLQSGGTP
jgi:hypothetical protein